MKVSINSPQKHFEGEEMWDKKASRMCESEGLRANTIFLVMSISLLATVVK
jgi:hypothetical protein